MPVADVPKDRVQFPPPSARGSTAFNLAIRGATSGSGKPRSTPAEDAVEVGLKEMAQLIEARPDLPTGLKADDLKRMTADGATPASGGRCNSC